MELTVQTKKVAEHTFAKAVWCPYCDCWYEGYCQEFNVLDMDYAGGTSEDEVGWNVIFMLPCGCEFQDGAEMSDEVLEVSGFWRCEHCYAIHGDDLAGAVNCCKG